MIDFNGKKFKAIQTSENGEVNEETTFYYKETGSIVTAVYSGGKIIIGQLMAIKKEGGVLDIRYHHINTAGELMTGICESTPELLADGRLRLYERWKWTSGNNSEGESIVEEFYE